MRRSKRLLCLLIAGMLILGVAFAEDSSGEGESSSESETVTTNAPSETTATPTATPTPETTDSSSADATPTPTPAASAGTSESPSATEGTETTDPTAAVTSSPEATETVTPTDTPEPTEEPTETIAPGTPVIEITSGATERDDVWLVPVQSMTDVITFSWTTDLECESYTLTLTDPEGNETSLGTTTETTYDLAVTDLTEGTYVLKVGAVYDEETTLWGTISFALEASGMMMGGFGGGMSFGGLAGLTGSVSLDGMEGEVAGFTVTPGVALTDDHASGTKIMTLFGTVELEIDDEEAMEILTVDDTELDVTLDLGASTFTAVIEDTIMTLTPSESGSSWQLNGAALRTLTRSGIETLELVTDSGTISFDTEISLTGTVYAGLCAQGIVSKDYVWTATSEGVTVCVNDTEYEVNAGGELVPLGG